MSGLNIAWLSLTWMSFVSAIRFLTIIPVPGAAWPSEHNNQSIQAGSLLFYPLVGALLGACLFAIYLVVAHFSGFSEWLSAAILLTAWVILTGALHLDGLADSADGWLGGHGDRDKTLSILRDTHSGVAAIVSILLALLLKLVLLVELDASLMVAIFLAPVIARAAVTGLLVSTPYVRDNGIASLMVSALPVKKIWVSLIILSLAIILWGRWKGVLIIVSVVLAVMVFRFLIMRRLGGTTGDTAGALIELVELLVLFDFVVIEQW